MKITFDTDQLKPNWGALRGRCRGLPWGTLASVGTFVNTLILVLAFAVLPNLGGLHLPFPWPFPHPHPTPGPVDPFQSSLATAYARETDAQKAQHVQALAEVYRQMQPQVSKADTAGALYDTLHGAVQGVIGDSLPLIREAVAQELDKALPTNRSAVLDDPAKQHATSAFGKVADGLAKLK